MAAPHYTLLADNVLDQEAARLVEFRKQMGRLSRDELVLTVSQFGSPVPEMLGTDPDLDGGTLCINEAGDAFDRLRHALADHLLLDAAFGPDADH